MGCEERDRLNGEYRRAVYNIEPSGRNVLDIKSAKWREATRDERAVAKKALDAVNEHRKQHGC
jgi:hypothetical protein